MKITADYLRQLIKEETQGEMEFAELEAARQAYLQDPNDDTRHELALMEEKLVEPIMAKLGLFFEAEAFYNRGELVFTNYKNMDVTVDPRGAMGRYDVLVNPLYDAHHSFDPVEISLDTMKGVVQYIKDEFEEELSRGGKYRQPPRGMVGEPEDQMELPLENKMRITKSQLQRVIKEAIKEEMGDRISGKDMLAMYDAEQGLDKMSAEEAMEELDNILTDIRQTSTDARSAKQAYRAEDMLRVITRG